MTTATESKLRDEWRGLNIQLNQIFRTIKMNTASGYVFGEEHLSWVESLKERRDYLTTIVK